MDMETDLAEMCCENPSIYVCPATLGSCNGVLVIFSRINASISDAFVRCIVLSKQALT